MASAGSLPADDDHHHQQKQGLVEAVTEYVKAYMANYDGSHDFQHIRRVLGLAQTIHARTPPSDTSSSSSSGKPPRGDPQVVVLAALLHDVGDKKYLRPDEDATTLVRDVLLARGASPALAAKVQAVCSGVSYSSEVKDPDRVRALLEEHPELAVVQDADRLDAIGAVGIGRVFTFSGARTKGGSMADSVQHFHDKLLRLRDMMKTDVGRQMAEERTERMRQFLAWWGEEEEAALAQDAAVLPPL